MSKFVMPITTAVLLFPLIAALITAPFLIYKYRKVGSVPWLHAAAMYSFVFYLMCAYFLVLLPLPPGSPPSATRICTRRFSMCCC